MSRRSPIILFLMTCILFTGCSSIRRATMPDEENLLSGAGSVIVGPKKGEASEFEQIDIDKLLTNYGFKEPKSDAYINDPTASQAQLQYRRNDLQDRIIAASNQRCGAYLRVLVSSKSQTQMGWGSLTTLLTGAATVTTPISAARVLTAGSTVSSGVMGVYNEAYFNNLTVNVISAGIAKQREGLLQYMDAGRGKDMKDYPVNRAIADALSYHAACNIVSGLEAAASATNTADALKVAGKPAAALTSTVLPAPPAGVTTPPK